MMSSGGQCPVVGGSELATNVVRQLTGLILGALGCVWLALTSACHSTVACRDQASRRPAVQMGVERDRVRRRAAYTTWI